MRGVNLLLSNVYTIGMQRTCPIRGQRLGARADSPMAECGLGLIEGDYGIGSAEDLTWECPECYGAIADHGDSLLAQCSRMLIMGARLTP